jgi:hypothetical protein
MKTSIISYNYFKLLTIVSAFLLIVAAAQAQPQTDLASVVQKCIDLPDLQSHYPTNPDGTKKAVHVMHRDVVLPTNLGVTKFGQPLILMHRAQIVGNLIETFLMFHELDITGNQAKVKFGYTYGSIDNPQLMTIMLSLQKNGEIWSITNSIIEQ